jgi:hypothetical protein
MDVPLWLYLLTTFGVAAMGVGGVMLSNRQAGRQTDKQLARDRERVEEDRAAEHERWHREKRVQTYEEFLRLTGLVEYHSGRVVTSNDLPPLEVVEDLQRAQDAFLLWAPDAVAEALHETLQAIARLAASLIVFNRDRSGSTRHRAMEALKEVEKQRAHLRGVMQQDLGVST